MATMDQVRELDREINAATDPERMRALIARRRMIRAELSLEQALEQHRREYPSMAPSAFHLFGTLPRR